MSAQKPKNNKGWWFGGRSQYFCYNPNYVPNSKDFGVTVADWSNGPIRPAQYERSNSVPSHSRPTNKYTLVRRSRTWVKLVVHFIVESNPMVRAVHASPVGSNFNRPPYINSVMRDNRYIFIHSYKLHPSNLPDLDVRIQTL